jgi:hypothetical protein
VVRRRKRLFFSELNGAPSASDDCVPSSVIEHDSAARPRPPVQVRLIYDQTRSCSNSIPEYAAGLLYNIACCESLAGRTEDALEDLRRAIEQSERFRAFAEGDLDFEPIRDEPAFRELVGR